MAQAGISSPRVVDGYPQAALAQGLESPGQERVILYRSMFRNLKNDLLRSHALQCRRKLTAQDRIGGYVERHINIGREVRQLLQRKADCKQFQLNLAADLRCFRKPQIRCSHRRRGEP